MKATVNRQLFMEYISIIPADYGASVLIADGVLAVASFGQGITARMPAYVIKNGQAFLNSDEWNNLISRIENVCDAYVDVGD
ncbi:MAG: hypothetical protein H6Q68_3578 [Firmicutes bacterium]|nr:hypothetical protein [Bacillota bacterium]